jgi:hypothetical protein
LGFALLVKVTQGQMDDIFLLNLKAQRLDKVLASSTRFPLLLSTIYELKKEIEQMVKEIMWKGIYCFLSCQTTMDFANDMLIHFNRVSFIYEDKTF